MGTGSFLRRHLSERHTTPTNPSPQIRKPEEELRKILLQCATLSEAEVDEYIAHQFYDVEDENVPLDYELTADYDPDAGAIQCLYADGLLQSKWIKRHKNPISPETAEKVKRVLPLVYVRFRAGEKS